MVTMSPKTVGYHFPTNGKASNYNVMFDLILILQRLSPSSPKISLFAYNNFACIIYTLKSDKQQNWRFGMFQVFS